MAKPARRFTYTIQTSSRTLHGMVDDAPDPAPKRRVTSRPLSRREVVVCWTIGGALFATGIAATFTVGTGAASAALIAFGGVFCLLGFIQRVPLNLEIAGTKLDASYEEVVAEAFDAGREIGVNQAIEVALNDVEKAEESGEAPHLALERRRDALQGPIDWQGQLAHRPVEQGPSSGQDLGYRGPTACNAAGITYRQLDYWARTGLVEPTVRPARGAPGSQRLYSELDVVLLRVIKRLLDAGISLQQIRTAVVHLRAHPTQALQRVTLMSDGQSVYETTSSEEIIDLLQSGKGMFGVSVGAVQEQIRDTLRQLPAEHAAPDEPPERPEPPDVA